MNGYLSQSAASVLFHHLSLLALSFLCKDVRPVCHSLHPACLSSFLPIPSSALRLCVFPCAGPNSVRVCVCVYHVPDHYLSPTPPPLLCVCGVNQGQRGSVGRHSPSHPHPPPRPHHASHPHTPRGFSVCVLHVCVCLCVLCPSCRLYVPTMTASALFSSAQHSSAPWINYRGTHCVSDLHRRTN